MCSFVVDDVSKVCNFFFSKFAFLRLNIETILAKSSENFLDMF